ncbi:MAG: DUF2934 domain-containing protein [Gemmataceae bacterium]|nr:DUF2934 domain-containing protein [Gemmataceae bacterium]
MSTGAPRHRSTLPVPGRVAELTAMLDARTGDLSVSTIDDDEVESFQITGVDESDYTLTWNGQPVPLRKIVLNIDALMSDGSHEIGQFVFGELAVEEGIAYLVDRMVAGDGTGTIGPENAPPFPYWVLRELALTGSAVDLTTIEIASLGTLALLTPDPAGIFLELRDDYASRRAGGRSMAEALDDVWQNLRTDVEGVVQTIIDHELPSLVAVHRDRGLMEHAVDWLESQYASVLQRRLEHPLFDLKPFSHNGLNRARLNELLRTTLPCDVILEQAGEMHQVERDVLITFGMPGQAAHGYRLSDFLRTLEAQRDFVLSHLGNDDILASADVENETGAADEEDVNPCPFYSACGLELRRNHSEICFRRPWRIFDPGRPANCWYGTAVACTLSIVRIGNVLRDPREGDQEHRRIVMAVQKRAYQIWEERSHEQGNDWAHWLQARHELGIPDDYFV